MTPCILLPLWEWCLKPSETTLSPVDLDFILQCFCSWPWQQWGATGGKEQDCWQHCWAWEWGSIRLTREKPMWISLTVHWRVKNTSWDKEKFKIYDCMMLCIWTNSQFRMKCLEGKQNKNKSKFWLQILSHVVEKMLCLSWQRGRERKETQKAEQRIEKETCSTENDEVKSQSKFQIIDYAELEGMHWDHWVQFLVLCRKPQESCLILSGTVTGLADLKPSEICITYSLFLTKENWVNCFII